MRSPVTADTERLLETFLDLVRIYSPSGGEAAAARYCEDALRSAGCSVAYDASAPVTGSDSGNLIAVLPGEVPSTLVLSAHLDMVEPCRDIEPIVEDGTIFSAGETILGADDRAGLAAAIECVRRLAEDATPHPTVKCVFTVKEEVGLLGAKQLTADVVAGDLCLVLDAAGDPGGIVVAAPTHYTFTAEFGGRAAHAGVEPEKGVSAIAIAARAICAMPFGRLDENTTANVGSIECSGATNVVAPRARIAGECRSLVRERVEEVRALIDGALREAAEHFGGSIEVEWNLEYEGFSVSEGSDAFRTVAEALETMGLAAHANSTGGGSDANVIAALGVPTVALSCGMTGVHGIDEEISVAALNATADVCLAVARRMSARG